MRATLKLTVDPFEGQKDSLKTEKSISVSTEVGSLAGLSQTASSVFFAQLDALIGDVFETIDNEIKKEEEKNKNQLNLSLPVSETTNDNSGSGGVEESPDKPKRKRASQAKD